MNRFREIHWSLGLAFAACLPLLACTDSGETGDDDSAGDNGTGCWEDLSVGDAVAVAEGFADGTEGLAFQDGRLFVTAPDGVHEVAADGSTQKLVSLESALGLAPWDGGLAVAVMGEFTFSGDTDGQVMAVSLTGEVTELASALSNPNFVVATPWGSLLVSDDTAPRIDEIRPGVAGFSSWTTAVESPNGMVFSADGLRLFVASTFVTGGPLWRVVVEGEDLAGQAELWASLTDGGANDGVARDQEGGIWVAANLTGELWRVEEETGEAEIRVTGLTNPASLAFGEGENWDPCSIYLTELYGERVMRVATGISGG